MNLANLSVSLLQVFTVCLMVALCGFVLGFFFELGRKFVARFGK
jgi:hypothetical protein